MKKIIAIVLAIMMTLSAFGISASAETTTTTVKDLQAQYPDKVVIVFQTAGFKMGTMPPSADVLAKLTPGDAENPGEYAMTGKNFYHGARVNFPTIKTSDETKTAIWALLYPAYDEDGNVILDRGYTVNPTSTEGFIIPANLRDNVLIFYASEVAVQKTSTLGKIISVFAKIIKAVLGPEIARAFLEMIVNMDFDLDIDIDAIIPPTTTTPANP